MSAPRVTASAKSNLEYELQMQTSRYICCAHRPWNIRRFNSCRDRLPGEWKLLTEAGDLTPELVSEWTPTTIFLVDWSWIIPSSIFSTVECIAFHPADLPYGRGGSPYQNLIMRGQYESVLTAFQVTKEIDAGPIYLKKPISLLGRAEEFFEQTAEVTFQMIHEIISKRPEPKPQQGDVVTFKRRGPRDNRLPLEDAVPRQVYDMIRMLDAPTYPNAYFCAGKYRLTFTDAKLEDDTVEARVVFQLLDGKPK